MAASTGRVAAQHRKVESRLWAGRGGREAEGLQVCKLVVWTGRSERPEWRAFDFCSITTNATEIGVFSLAPREIQ